MEWGPHETTLQLAKRKGKRVKALEDKPELYGDLQMVWDAFNDLHRARPVGFGASPIPLSSIMSWLDIHGIGGDSAVEIYELISAMDGVWLNWARNKEKQDADSASSNRRPRSRSRS